jgi:hypothetical protein
VLQRPGWCGLHFSNKHISPQSSQYAKEMDGMSMLLPGIPMLLLLLLVKTVAAHFHELIKQVDTDYKTPAVIAQVTKVIL